LRFIPLKNRATARTLLENKRLLEEELDLLGQDALRQREDVSLLNRTNLSISFKVQPSSSPDLNVLDLGIWTSVAKGVRSDSTVHGDRLDRKFLMEEVNKRFWVLWDSVSALRNIYNTKRNILLKK